MLSSTAKSAVEDIFVFCKTQASFGPMMEKFQRWTTRRLIFLMSPDEIGANYPEAYPENIEEIFGMLRRGNGGGK